VTQFNSLGTGLVYSTYLGGSSSDQGNGIAVDGSGNAYVTGLTFSSDFPTTVGAYQIAFAGNPTSSNAFMTKLNSLGTTLDYSTYLGGSGTFMNGDQGNGIAVDSSGNVYVTGRTVSSDFPTTSGAYQTTFSGNTAFIAKFELGLPVVASLTPPSGPASGGTSVTITGTNFIGTTAVDFGLNPASSFIVNSDTQITVTSPSGNPGTTVDVTVTTPNGTSLTSPADQFTYLNPAPINPFSPTNLKGHQVKNRFATQTDYVNILQWSAPAGGTVPLVSYRIYRNAQLTQLIATIPSSGPLQYEDHNRVPGKTYRYFVVSVDALGDLSAFATVKVPGQ